MIQKKIFSRIASPLVFIAVLMFVTLSASCKTEDEKKLESLFANGNYPFTNIQGEASELADFILKNKEAFLLDLNYVLQNNHDDLFVIADKSHFLEKDYKPSDVLPLEKNDDYVFYRNDLSLRTPAEKALRVMGQAAKNDGITLVVSSTFRSYDYQKIVYERNVKQMGQAAADRESARPGTSQHQLGTAVDFGSITDEYAETKAGKWLASIPPILSNTIIIPPILSYCYGYSDGWVVIASGIALSEIVSCTLIGTALLLALTPVKKKLFK